MLDLFDVGGVGVIKGLGSECAGMSGLLTSDAFAIFVIDVSELPRRGIADAV